MRRHYQELLYKFLLHIPFMGDRILHMACRAAAGKYNLLLSTIVNLHPL